MNTRTLLPALLALPALVLISCQSLNDLGEATLGQLPPDLAESVVPGGGALAKSFQQLTPEQEHYIGRATSVVILGNYNPLERRAANAYLNTLGQTLATFSDRPETFGGYRFLLLDSDEINAFAAPGGLIFVSRGMVRLCENEEELAAVLAHEIGHIQLQHGLKAIKRGRLTSGLTALAASTAKEYGSEELKALTEAFEGSVSDVTATLMNNGYGRALEYEADTAAVGILHRAGYEPRSLLSVLVKLDKNLKPDGVDFAKTHPEPLDRVGNINKAIATVRLTAVPLWPARAKRFQQFLSAL